MARTLLFFASKGSYFPSLWRYIRQQSPVPALRTPRSGNNGDVQAIGGNRRPYLHPMLMPYPSACLIGALLTDLAYSWTAEMMWADFSAWLVAAGVMLGWLAAIAGVIDLIRRRHGATSVHVWVYGLCSLAILILATVNMLVHTRDAWTSVVPWGLTLSAVTTILLLVTSSLGWIDLYRSEEGARV